MTQSDDLHLCQPDQGKSCGACCGLYNYADSRREALSARLRNRTALYREIPKSPEGLRLFSSLVREREDQAQRYEVIYCCEYLGFMDDEERRVGCLLHPAVNEGVDLREVSFYGRDLCAGHLCPSYYYLSRNEKQALFHICNDWYLYGLIVTDIDLVKAFFRLISDEIGEEPPAKLFRDSVFQGLAADFFSLKLTWPFRSPDIHRFGKYYFDGSQYMIKYIDYDRLGRHRSPFDGIFLSLSSVFTMGEELDRAEGIIRSHITRFIYAYREWVARSRSMPSMVG